MGGRRAASSEGFVEKVTELFMYNWVVTNGTISIPDGFKNTLFIISLDGTEDYHDQNRGRAFIPGPRTI